VNIEQALGKSMALQIGYVGSAGTKLFRFRDLNQEDPATSTFPFAGFNVINQFESTSSSRYNSLQVNLTRRVSNFGRLGTMYFILGYTYAHSIDTASGFRNTNGQVPAFNSKLFRASSDFDLRHRLTISGGWDLPFDRTWDSGPKKLTKGWSIYPIISYRTGFAMDFGAGGDYASDVGAPGATGAGDNDIVRPNLVGPVGIFDPHGFQTINGQAGNYYFNPTNITRTGLPAADTFNTQSNPALATYGSLPRNFLRGPSRFNADFAISKVTPLKGDRIKMEFRSEFFNIFNSTQFNNPNTNIDSTHFGQVQTTLAPRIIQFALRLSF